MMLICFDVDGTLVTSFMREGGSVEDYDKVEVLPGRLEWFRKAPVGLRYALVTNQAGVAMGHQTEDQVRAKMGLVCAKLHFLYHRPFSVHISFNHPRAKLNGYRKDSSYRKPGPGMIWEAQEVHRRGAEQTLMVGDMDSDVQAAEAAGAMYRDAEDFFAEPPPPATPISWRRFFAE